MRLTKLYDVIKAVRDCLKSCMTSVKFYVGTIPETKSRPSFLIDLAFSKDSRTTFLTQSRTLSIQLIYFGTLDEYKKENVIEQLETIETLRPFLNKFILNVGDRTLNFEYEIGQADEQLSITLDFKFKDSIYITQQDFEMIQNIFINEEEMS